MWQLHYRGSVTGEWYVTDRHTFGEAIALMDKYWKEPKIIDAPVSGPLFDKFKIKKVR